MIFPKQVFAQLSLGIERCDRRGDQSCFPTPIAIFSPISIPTIQGPRWTP